MKIILLGPPGAGKGTLAVELAKMLNIKHISTGQVLRESIANQSPIGVKVKSLIENGGLVDDVTMIDLVRDYLNSPDLKNGYILDGFPRTIAQAEAFSYIEMNIKIILLDLDNEIIVNRLSGRRVHLPSGRIYHVETNPPKNKDKDDITGEDLSIRADDKPESIRKRLEVYDSETKPLIDYYKDRLIKVDASKTIPEVLAFVKKILNV